MRKVNGLKQTTVVFVIILYTVKHDEALLKGTKMHSNDKNILTSSLLE